MTDEHANPIANHPLARTFGESPRIIDMRIADDSIVAHLADGRVISVPLAWSWCLSEATPAQRSNFEFIGSGLGVH